MRRQVASPAQSHIGGQGDEKDSAKSNEGKDKELVENQTASWKPKGEDG